MIQDGELGILHPKNLKNKWKNADEIKELKIKLEIKNNKTEEDIKEMKKDIRELDKEVDFYNKIKKKKH